MRKQENTDFVLTWFNGKENAMHPDSEKLVTVPALLDQEGELVTISLLKPFTTSQDVDQSKVSHLKLLSGNESGINVSIDGNQLILDLEAYRDMVIGETELLGYQYRINDPLGEYSRHTVKMVIAQTEEGRPGISEAVLTSDKQFENLHSLHEESEETVPVNSFDEEAETMVLSEEDTFEFIEQESQELLSDSVEDPEEIEETVQADNTQPVFSFNTPDETLDEESVLEAQSQPEPDLQVDNITYEDLTPEPPEPALDETDEPTVDYDAIAREVDEAIIKADQLMDSAFSFHEEEQTTPDSLNTDIEEVVTEPAIENVTTPETALEEIIQRVPSQQREDQPSGEESHLLLDEESQQHPESSLKALIERLPNDDVDEGNLGNQSESVNHPHTSTEAPTSAEAPATEIIIEDETYIFNLEDFKYPIGDKIEKLECISLETIPESGVILYNKKPAMKGQVLSRKVLLTGRLSYRIGEPLDSPVAFSHTSFIDGEYLGPFTVVLKKSEAEDNLQEAEDTTDNNLDIEISDFTEDSLVASGNVYLLPEKPISEEETADTVESLDIVSATIEGSYGLFIVNSGGSWTYSADIQQDQIRNLQSSDSLEESFTLLTEEGYQYTLSLRIVGPGQSPAVTSGKVFPNQ